jgi:hypothetical protein
MDWEGREWEIFSILSKILPSPGGQGKTTKNSASLADFLDKNQTTDNLNMKQGL